MNLDFIEIIVEFFLIKFSWTFILYTYFHYWIVTAISRNSWVSWLMDFINRNSFNYNSLFSDIWSLYMCVILKNDLNDSTTNNCT